MSFSPSIRFCSDCTNRNALYDEKKINEKKERVDLLWPQKGFGSTFVPAPPEKIRVQAVISPRAPRAARLEGTKAAERFRKKFTDIKAEKDEEFWKNEKRRERARKQRQKFLAKQLEKHYKEKYAQRDEVAMKEAIAEKERFEKVRLEQKLRQIRSKAQKEAVAKYKDARLAREIKAKHQADKKAAALKKRNEDRLRKRRELEDRKCLPEELEARKLARAKVVALAKKKRDLHVEKMKKQQEKESLAAQERVRKERSASIVQR